ncbi:MAG: hypothetical protein RJA49_2132 [Actinomycetota bacterium]
MGTYYSFHHDDDVWRARRVARLGGNGSQTLLSGQEWAAVCSRREGSATAWIDEQMRFAGAVVVLVGTRTDQCPWVRREILRAWEDCRPLLGIHVDGLADRDGSTARPGGNPFLHLKFRSGGWMSDYVPVFRPDGDDDESVRASIAESLPGWIARGARRMGPRQPRTSAVGALLRR